MKKFLIGLLACFSLYSYTFAASYPDSFQVEVDPPTFKVNQAVDMKITAIKDGEVMKDYEGSFSIYVTEDNNLLQSHEATVPEGGWGTMKLENQGVVPYTQGLIIKKPGTFVINVVEFTDDNISGTATFTVSSDNVIVPGNITILSPDQNITEEQSPISIMANAPDYTNARIQIYLNGLMVKEGMTDGNGFLSDSIQVGQAGTNTLELRAVNLQGATVAQSQIISFLYSPISDDLLDEIVMTPNRDIKIGDKVRFEITTDEHASSAKLYLSGTDNDNNNEFLMDKEGDGYFSKDLSLPATGNFVANVELTAATEARLYTGTLYFTVDQNVQITNLKIYGDEEKNGLVHVSWDTDGGDSDDYVVLYWEKDVGSEDSNPWQEFSTGKAYDLTLAPGRTYEFRVYATDADHFQEGVPSDVVEFAYEGIIGSGPDEPTNYSGVNSMCDDGHCVATPPTCVVGSIKFTTEEIGNKNYLVWSPVENVTKYLVYKSDFEDGSNKQFVGETELTRFEYPFDKSAKSEVYAYYTIEAICTDGQKVIVTEVNKVKVGPFEDMLLILVSTLLLYFMYRVYTYRV